jgi:hypothetical protein
VLGGQTVVLDAFGEGDVGDFEDGEAAVEFAQEELPSAGVSDDHHVRVFHVFAETVDLVQGELLSRVVIDVREEHHELAHEIVQSFCWFFGSGHHYLNGFVVVQNVFEFIMELDILFERKQMALGCALFVFDSYGFLAFLGWEGFTLLSGFGFEHL